MQLQTVPKAQGWLQSSEGATVFHRPLSQWRRDAGNSDYLFEVYFDPSYGPRNL